MNHKRNKPRRKVRCSMCTPHRNGNTKSHDALNARDRRNLVREHIERQLTRADR